MVTAFSGSPRMNGISSNESLDAIERIYDCVGHISSFLVPLHQCRFVDVVEVLAGLSALYIQRRFGYDFVEVSDVTMETVMVANDNDVEVTHVENCTCDSSSSHAAGASQQPGTLSPLLYKALFTISMVAKTNDKLKKKKKNKKTAYTNM